MAFPESRLVETNGIELEVYEAGPEDGVPIVLCHGFPELAYSWRHQIPVLADAGYRVIAPNQRGYGRSGKPAAVTEYDIHHLTADLTGLLDRYGIDKAIFCGHDWGGMVVWQMALMHPNRVAGVIGLNTPFMPRGPSDPIAGMRERFGPDMYIVWFQNPDDPEAVLGADTHKTLSFFMRRPTGSPVTAQPNASGSTFAFKDLLQQWDGTADLRDPLLTPEELKVFADAFRDGGFFGPVSWYRNFTRNWELAEGLPSRIDNVPCLMITAELDAVLPPSAAEHMPALISDLETHLVKGSGHWTQQEKPDEVNRLMLDWLDKRFPK